MKTLQMFNSEYGLMLFPSSSFGEMEWWYVTVPVDQNDCNGMSILDCQLKQHTIEKYKKKLLHL